MRTLEFRQEPSYPLIFLVQLLRGSEIKKEYLDAHGIPSDDVQCIFVPHGKMVSQKEMKSFVADELVPHLKTMDVRYLVACDSSYFKLFTGQANSDQNLGYVRPCLFGPWQVVYVPTFKQIFYDPEKTRTKIKQGLDGLKAHINGTYQEPGNGIVRFEGYPLTPNTIAPWLERLIQEGRDLTCDIEAFSLKHYKAGIGTISFAWSKHEGISFPVDYRPQDVTRCGCWKEESEIHRKGCSEYPDKPFDQSPFGQRIHNAPVRALLRDFFERFTGKLTFHNIAYDVYNLIFQLFMKDVLDTEGLLEGLNVMLRSWDCTQLITYLATNSCAGNELGLKANTQEFSGIYSIEMDDITKHPLDKVLRYNLIDSLSTWYLYEKNHPKMVADEQEGIYELLFKPSTWDIIQMQLTGLPVNMKRVKEVKAILEADQKKALTTIRGTKTVEQFTYLLREKHVKDRNAKLKKKKITLQDKETQEVEFNPNSGPQLQWLLYEMLGLPVIDLTDKKNPATGGETLKKLANHTTDPDVKSFLSAMQDFSDVDILLTTFIPAFEDAVEGPDGWHYLIGSFRLGGTISGRMSSRNPNMQNIPAGSRYAKLIKSIFEAPPGWLFCGLDFASLEDKISALTTKDPNKLKVYLDGYDGHCLRAYAYWGDRMPDIDPNSVASINSIKDKYPVERYEGKRPTFALTYQGTWITLVRNLGFEEAQAKQLEIKYHVLYAVSDQWIQAKLDQAAKDGYITAAFGLRVRTPLLEQVIRGNSKTPHEAEAEGRSAGNALGQSWCLLTNRASVEFMGKVRSGPYRLDIRPCAHIHDAQYFLIREDMATLLYANTHLVKAVEWQEHPDIRHPDVHLGGVFSIFWPSWVHDIEIPNGADEAGLMAALEAKLERA